MRHVPGQPEFGDKSDDQLVMAANAGDRDALVEFLRRHWSDLERRASAFAPRGEHVSHGADDIMSTVTRRVLLLVQQGRFLPQKSIDAHRFIRTIMRRAIARVFRRQRIERDALVRRKAVPMPSGKTESVRRVVAQTDLAGIVSGLSEVEYRLLLMRLQGRAYADIAASIGCNAVAARQRWRALRTKLGIRIAERAE